MIEIHPELPCGFNSVTTNLDEYNGSGVNWDVMPVRFETFEGLTVIVLTPEMLSYFDERADLVLPCEPDTATIRPQDIEILVGGLWSTHFTSIPARPYRIPGQLRTVHVSNRWPGSGASAPAGGVTLAREQRTKVVRGRP